MRKLLSGALLALGFFTLTGLSDTNEIGCYRYASFRTTGTLLITPSSTDASGRALSTWTKITRIRFVAGGTGAGGTVTLAVHLAGGWATFTLDDNAEWSEEMQFKSLSSIHAASAKTDSVAIMTMGGVSGQLILGGEGG